MLHYDRNIRFIVVIMAILQGILLLSSSCHHKVPPPPTYRVNIVVEVSGYNVPQQSYDITCIREDDNRYLGCSKEGDTFLRGNYIFIVRYRNAEDTQRVYVDRDMTIRFNFYKISVCLKDAKGREASPDKIEVDGITQNDNEFYISEGLHKLLIYYNKIVDSRQVRIYKDERICVRLTTSGSSEQPFQRPYERGDKPRYYYQPAPETPDSIEVYIYLFDRENDYTTRPDSVYVNGKKYMDNRIIVHREGRYNIKAFKYNKQFQCYCEIKRNPAPIYIPFQRYYRANIKIVDRRGDTISPYAIRVDGKKYIGHTIYLSKGTHDLSSYYDGVSYKQTVYVEHDTLIVMLPDKIVYKFPPDCGLLIGNQTIYWVDGVPIELAMNNCPFLKGISITFELDNGDVSFCVLGTVPPSPQEPEKKNLLQCGEKVINLIRNNGRIRVTWKAKFISG